MRWVAGFARLAALSCASLAANSATAPTAADMARCAGIAASDARLACYDTLAGRAVDPMTPSAAVGSSAAATATTAARANPPAAGTGAVAGTGVVAGTAAAQPAGSAPAAAANDPRNFGFNQAQLHIAPPGGSDAVHAIVSSITQDRLGHTTVLLDNGQRWTYTDEDGRLSTGNAVNIKRAALGSFMMTTPSKRSYSVHRIQ